MTPAKTTPTQARSHPAAWGGGAFPQSPFHCPVGSACQASLLPAYIPPPGGGWGVWGAVRGHCRFRLPSFLRSLFWLR